MLTPLSALTPLGPSCFVATLGNETMDLLKPPMHQPHHLQSLRTYGGIWMWCMTQLSACEWASSQGRGCTAIRINNSSTWPVNSRFELVQRGTRNWHVQSTTSQHPSLCLWPCACSPYGCAASSGPGPLKTCNVRLTSQGRDKLGLDWGATVH
jgi:hypothetical protein